MNRQVKENWKYPPKKTGEELRDAARTRHQRKRQLQKEKRSLERGIEMLTIHDKMPTSPKVVDALAHLVPLCYRNLPDFPKETRILVCIDNRPTMKYVSLL